MEELHSQEIFGVIYETEKIPVTDTLKQKGYKGEVSAKVTKEADGTFIASIKGVFEDGVDALDILPTSHASITNEETARGIADAMLKELLETGDIEEKPSN